MDFFNPWSPMGAALYIVLLFFIISYIKYKVRSFGMKRFLTHLGFDLISKSNICEKEKETAFNSFSYFFDQFYFSKFKIDYYYYSNQMDSEVYVADHIFVDKVSEKELDWEHHCQTVLFFKGAGLEKHVESLLSSVMVSKSFEIIKMSRPGWVAVYCYKEELSVKNVRRLLEPVLGTSDTPILQDVHSPAV